jgi:hypothetical protein
VLFALSVMVLKLDEGLGRSAVVMCAYLANNVNDVHLYCVWQKGHIPFLLVSYLIISLIIN